VTRTETVRFRHHQAIWVAAVIAFLGTLPLASLRWYLTPLLLVPTLIGVWAFRGGTDADPTGIRTRALFGDRRIPWSSVAEFDRDEKGGAIVRLTDGRSAALPAVRAVDLPQLLTASGQRLQRATPEEPTDE
jgi:hypothetical protein